MLVSNTGSGGWSEKQCDSSITQEKILEYNQRMTNADMEIILYLYLQGCGMLSKTF